jgi:hypothetical protein
VRDGGAAQAACAEHAAMNAVNAADPAAFCMRSKSETIVGFSFSCGLVEILARVAAVVALSCARATVIPT